MAQQRQESKDLLTRLADAGEEALAKLGEIPGMESAATAVGGMRTRLDEMQKKLRGLDALEKRVAALERAAKQSTRKTASAGRKKTGAKKSSGSSPGSSSS